MAKERVFTVHGIWTQGPWQEQLQQILEPHFDVVHYKYGHYRWGGAFNFFFEPWVLLPGALLLYLSLCFGPNYGIPTPRGSLAWLGLVLVSFIGALVRRLLSHLSFRKKLPQRAHIIAHSYGTYLTGSAIKDVDCVRLRRIILVGCVLPRRFDWEATHKRNPYAFEAIRNDVAKRDIAVVAARFLSPLIPRFGWAGFRGFSESRKWVHDVGSPNWKCANCLLPSTPARVHNYICRELGHSGTFVGSGHAKTFWLPFLWGIEPNDYEEFVDICLGAKSLEDMHDDHRLSVFENDLLDRKWSWTDDKTLRDLMAKKVSSHRLWRTRPSPGPYSVDDLVEAAIQFVWQAIVRAEELAERRRIPKPHTNLAEMIRMIRFQESFDEEIMRMNPTIGLNYAVDLIVKVSVKPRRSSS